jgi:hypothetical protein
MSAISDRTLSVVRPVAMSPDSMRMPLLGVLWVVVNVALVGLGAYLHWLFACSFLAGLINGTVLSVIAVATAGARFQASASGLLGGLTLSGLRSDGSMISKCVQGLHGLADSALLVLGIEGSEQLHHSIEQEAIYMLWTMVFVILASLVAEWVRSTKSPA